MSSSSPESQTYRRAVALVTQLFRMFRYDRGNVRASRFSDSGSPITDLRFHGQFVDGMPCALTGIAILISAEDMSSSGEESEDSGKTTWREKRVLRMTSEAESSDSEELDVEQPDKENRPTAASTKPKAPAGRQKLPLRLKNPPFIDMIIEAVEDVGDQRKGVTVAAIKASMRAKHRITDASMKTHFKKQFSKAIEKGTLIRPQHYKDSKGLLGRFKLNPGHVKEKIKAVGKVKKSKELSKKGQESSQKKPLSKTKKNAQRKPTRRRSAVSDVNTEKLTSLKETSATAKAAKEKIKKARKSLGLSNSRKRNAASKKIFNDGSSKAGKSDKPKPKKTSQKKKVEKEKK